MVGPKERELKRGRFEQAREMGFYFRERKRVVYNLRPKNQLSNKLKCHLSPTYDQCSSNPDS